MDNLQSSQLPFSLEPFNSQGGSRNKVRCLVSSFYLNNLKESQSVNLVTYYILSNQPDTYGAYGGDKGAG